jgi:hypothetical protein
MDLEVVRWKTADDLDPEEAAFLRENVDKLNQEELDAFAEVLKEPEAEEEELEATGTGGEEEEKEEEEVEEKEEEKKPDAQYLTKDEANEFVQKALADREAAKKDAETGTAEEKAAKQEILKLFPDGYKPTDPNEFASKIVEALTPILTQKTIENIGQMNAAQRKQFDDANARLDAEYTEIAKKNGLPELSSEKGQLINGQLATVAAKYGIDNYHEAYELWSKLPAQYGGGFSVADEEKAQKKEALKGQKKAASMVGKSSGEGSTGGKNSGPTREEIATLDMDKLLDRATN